MKNNSFISHYNSTFDSRYKFTAKELDNETNYNYFGARYGACPAESGNSDVSVWLSVDPMSDERSWLSPYNYCQLNPLGRVDPSGALDDGFVVDLEGEIARVDNTGGNKFDVIYNKADYKAGKRDYDKTGTKNGIQVDRGEVSNFQSTPIKNLDGVQTGSLSNCEVKTEDVADKLFIFLADNTTVEWQNNNFTSPDGKSVNVIATSKEYGTITGGCQLDKSYMRKGYTLNKNTHSHPYDYNNGGEVSGFYGNTSGFGEGDFGVKQILQNFETKSGTQPGANAKFSMYWRGNVYPY